MDRHPGVRGAARRRDTGTGVGERVQLEAPHPRLDHPVFVGVVGKDPRRVVENQIVHLVEDRGPLRPVGQVARLVVERVEGGQAHARVVRRADVLAVEIAVVVDALGDVARPLKSPHHQLSGLGHLVQFGPFVLEESDPEADCVHVPLPQLVADSRRGIGRRSQHERQRFAVGQLAVTVAVAVPVAELVQQRACRLGVGAVGRHVLRIVAVQRRRHRLIRRDGLAIENLGNVGRAVEAHADRAPQRELVRRVAADQRIVEVEKGKRYRR